jgi:hypothetical protein
MGADYLLMPLCRRLLLFRHSPARLLRPGRAVARILTLLAAVPIAGAVLDAGENALSSA